MNCSKTVEKPQVLQIKFIWLWIFVLILVSILPYRHVIGRGFSDTDDFFELHRAITTDIPEPSKIFNTSHYTNRYRPVNRAMTAATTYLFDMNAQAFLLRNLLFHIISVIIVFRIALALTGNPYISALSSGLFALHPSNVNLIGVAIFTHSFGSCLVLFVFYLLLQNQIEGLPRTKHYKNWLSLVLLTIVTFSAELFLWVLPIFAMYMIWLFFRTGEKRYMMVASAAVLVVLSFLTVRHLIVEHKAYVMASGNYSHGLRGFRDFLMNLGMYLAAAGFLLDPLFFFNPVSQTLPTGSDLFTSPGIIFSLGLSAVFLSATIIGVTFAFIPSRRNCHNMLAMLFFTFFLLSLSVVLVAAKASETYMYLPNAFMALSQCFLILELKRTLNESASKWRKIFDVSLSVVLLVIIAVRFYGVEERNMVLADKARRISYMQNEIRRTLSGTEKERIVFIPLCQSKTGYSVYGGQGLGMLHGRDTEFVQLTLGNPKIKASLCDRCDMKDIESQKTANTKLLFYDGSGSIYEKTQESFRCM